MITILSQNKKVLVVNCESIHLTGFLDIVASDARNAFNMGQYESEERMIEILEEIFDCIRVGMVQRKDSLYEMPEK